MDGPEFDASRVNFDVLMQRNAMYREQERQSIERLQANPEAEVARVRESIHAHQCAAEAAGVKGMSNNPLPNKERVKLPRQRMPEQDAQVRAGNFLEVNVGFTPEQAQQESLRCIECNKPGCMTKCPVAVDVRAVMDFIVKGDYLGAAAKVREDNALPAITGRVCPVEDQCESGCVLGKKGEPIGIAYLERFVADWERSSGQFGLPKSKPATGKKIAIVGSGPAGLACAGDLIQWPNIAKQIEIDAKYDRLSLAPGGGYRRLSARRELQSADEIDYAALPGLSNEAKQKLVAHRPRTIGHAAQASMG